MQIPSDVLEALYVEWGYPVGRGKFIGITYKFNLNPVVPLTWSEISENLVSYILFSFILSLIMSYFLIYAVDEYKKQQIIDLEAARKRIKEKEKNDQNEIEELNKDRSN